MMKQTVIRAKKKKKVRQKKYSQSLKKEKEVRHRRIRGQESHTSSFLTFVQEPLPSSLKRLPEAPKHSLRSSLRIQQRFNNCRLNLCVLGRIIYQGFCFVWVFNGSAPAVHLGTEHSFNQQRVCSNPLGSFASPAGME